MSPRALEWTRRYAKDVELMLSRGADLAESDKAVTALMNREKLPQKYKDHKLNESKRWTDCRELHIKGDWLLIYRQRENVVTLLATGTHSDLYE